MVATPSVNVPVGVRRISFALPQDNIDNVFFDVSLTYPGVTGLVGSTLPAGGPPRVDSNTVPGTICRTYNGTYATNNSDWSFCHTPTPGGPNRL
ncbi:MAG: hypothetical protein ABIS92_03625 [Polyangia bacterium]